MREVSTRFRLCWAIQARYSEINGTARFFLGDFSTWGTEDWVDELWHLAYYMSGDFMMDRMPGDYFVFQHEIAFPACERIRFRVKCMRSLFPGSRLYEERVLPCMGGRGFDPVKFPLFLDSCGLLFVYPKDSKGEKPGHRRFRTMARLGL